MAKAANILDRNGTVNRADRYAFALLGHYHGSAARDAGMAGGSRGSLIKLIGVFAKPRFDS